MERTFDLKINGFLYHVAVEESMSLLTLLRDHLGLMGTKNGCHGMGHCGACTVIIDGEAKRSCLIKAARLEGASIETNENLAEGGRLHPLQRAFLEEGAVQCGFCTPGMIMAGKALLAKKNLMPGAPPPSQDEIKQALKFNLCRCTGYVSIQRAMERAAKRMQAGAEAADESGASCGLPIRQDGVAKVTGQALYADDLRADGMLYGKLLFSDHPHARILSIDTAEAAAAPGVKAVLTARDIPGRKTFGLHQAEQPVLAGEVVRYTGDPVAVVYASSEAAATAAAKRIKVAYQPLAGLFDPLTAMKEDAPRLSAGGNQICHTKVRKGDVADGFAKADVIIEGDYFTPMVEHAYLETESALATRQADGTIVVHTGSQSSFAMREAIAASLALPEEKVRVILTVTGGAFGGKEEPTIQIHAALGTWATGLPVKMTLTREESIRISTKRHAEYIHMRHGATKDGRLVAFESRAICDGGAYVSLSRAVVFRSAVVASGPYEIPHVKADAFGIYTNNNPGGAFRGFGSTQVAFAAEVQMDRLARALNMDPIEFRLKNALREGSSTSTGQILGEGVGFVASLEAVREAVKGFDVRPRKGGRIGIGIASSYKNVGIGTGKGDGAGAAIELKGDGRFLLRIGATENGQGSDMTMAMIAAKTLGVHYDLIDVLSSDTAETPDGGVTTASRQTFVTGNAVMCAARLLKEKLLAFARSLPALAAGAPEIEADGSVVAGKTRLGALDLFREAKARAEALAAQHYYDPPPTFPLRPSGDPQPGVDPQQYDIHYAYCFASQAALVEVDEQSGEVTVHKIVAAQDAGTAIHPQSVNGQIEGAVMMGVGYALHEEFKQNQGVIVTDTLAKLKVPSILKAPDIEPLIIEKADGHGPMGAKGMGEVPINPTAPAILNAIYDAVGVRITSLPARKEDILSAIRKKGGSNAIVG